MAWQRILTTCSTHLQRPLTSPCRLAIIRSNGSTGVVPAGKAVAAALPPLTGCCSLVTPFSSCSSRRMDSMHPGPSRPLATREQQEAVAPAAAAASAAAAAAAAGGSGVVAGGGQSPPLPPPPPPPPRPLRLDGIAGLPQFLKPDCLLFYSREMEPLARRAAELSGGKVQLGCIDWRCFPDGFPDLFVRDAHALRNRHVAFLAAFHSPGAIFEQISVIYALPRLFVASFTLVLPFFPTATMERVDAEGQVATAATLARIISGVPMSRGGPASVAIWDIHALQERFYFGDAVLPLLVSAVPMLRRQLRQLPDADNVVIAYPDEGAWKRFHCLMEEPDYDEGRDDGGDGRGSGGSGGGGSATFGPPVVCTKVRDGAKRIVRLKEGDPRGRHVVIVDDLVQSGGTLLEAHRVLAAAGAARISAFVTHAVFPKDSFRRFTPEAMEQEAGAAAAAAAKPVVTPHGHGDAAAAEPAASSSLPRCFSNFWITDSVPTTAAKLAGVAPFQVLSLAEPVAAVLQI